MRAALLLLVASLCSLACGGSRPAQPPTTTPGEGRAATPPAPAPAAAAGSAEAAQALPAEATFGDLARAAGARVTAGALDARGGCLLAAVPDGYTLTAELMPALHELPEALADFDAALERSRGPVRVLTAWGQVGALDPALALAAFTALPPQSLRAPAVALLLGDAGVYVRYGDGAAAPADGPLAVDAVTPHLLADPRGAGAVLYVTAESGTPLARVAELLRTLPHGRRVALAQLLPPGTRLPALEAAPPPGDQLCPEGLPELAAGSAEGELDPAAAVQALGPLREGASACLEGATGTARAGGRMTLALRIAADGSVARACLLQDGIGDAALGACVLQSARGVRMPAPDPAGVVDLHVPLALTPQAPADVQPLCE